MSQKVSYDSNTIDPEITRFSPNEVRSHFHICDQSIINTLGIRVLCLGFSNTSHVDSLDRLR